MGPPIKYLLLGTERWKDMVLVRALLQGLNSWGRQWNEVITIQGNGSLVHLESEVREFRCLKYQEITKLGEPNVVVAFGDSTARENEGLAIWLDLAYDREIPTYLFSEWAGWRRPRTPRSI